MTNGQNEGTGRYQLFESRDGYVLRDGTREIEVGTVLHHVGKHSVEVTLFRESVRHWDYPHNRDPLTDAMKEEILATMKRLIEARDPNFIVKIER